MIHLRHQRGDCPQLKPSGGRAQLKEPPIPIKGFKHQMVVPKRMESLLLLGFSPVRWMLKAIKTCTLSKCQANNLLQELQPYIDVQFTQKNAHNYNLTSSGMIVLVSWSISPHPPGKTRRNSSSKKPQRYLKSSQTADQFKAPVDSMLVVKPSVCCVEVCRFGRCFPLSLKIINCAELSWVDVTSFFEIFSGQSMVLSCKDSLH